MTWGFYLIVFWFVFLWTSPDFGAAWEGTSASGRTATRGSIARAVTKVNGYSALGARWAGRKGDHSLFLCGFLLAPARHHPTQRRRRPAHAALSMFEELNRGQGLE